MNNAMKTSKAFQQAVTTGQNIVTIGNTADFRQFFVQQFLRSIVQTAVFCGRQNIALRGHRDDGPHQGDPCGGQNGNFRQLLHFCVASGDTTLQKHLATTTRNAFMISKTTQNELIHFLW